MNTLPRTIHNPLIGDSVTFIETAEETSGAYILLEVTLSPGGGNGLHYHISFDEEFEVLEGVLGIDCYGQTLHLKAGETAAAPAKATHRFFNPSSTETVKFLCRITPACQFEEMLRIAYGLVNDGKTNKKGLPGILPLSIMFQKGETYMPNIPLSIQRGLFGLIAGLARVCGTDKQLEKYYKA